jgi:hypothetical protein
MAPVGCLGVVSVGHSIQLHERSMGDNPVELVAT